jgi:hypothetical protein
MTMGRLHACSLDETCVVRTTANLNQAWDNETFFVYPPVAPNQRYSGPKAPRAPPMDAYGGPWAG